MSVIFQLFSAEDLQKLDYRELQGLRKVIIEALGDVKTLSLKLTKNVEPEQDPPPRVQKALIERFQEVSHQLKSPKLNPAQPIFDFETLSRQRNDEDTQRRENLILEWAITCEVNNFEFYNSLLQAKKKAYDFFERRMRAKGETVPERLRPKGPDSLYSPFNRRHPLSSLFYDLSKPESNTTQDTAAYPC